MTTMPIITRNVLEAGIYCRYKAYLKLSGEQGTQSDYEVMHNECCNRVRDIAMERLRVSLSEAEILIGPDLSLSLLKQGIALLLNAVAVSDQFSFRFDGLKRMDGKSRLGEFHYIPLLYHGSQKIHKEQKRLLSVCGVLLSELQGVIPSCGLIYYGQDAYVTKVGLSSELKVAKLILEEVRQVQSQEAPARLILNDHCQVCEFSERCHAQAVEEDNLSLLRGMGEKEIWSCAKKGIFTVRQLSHTFRPRRKGKRAQPSKRHYHALQAMAIRDRTIYILGRPQLPESRPVHVYLDIEGLPDQGNIYLIGVIVSDGLKEERFSFWADSRSQEPEIFDALLSVLAQFDSCHVFSYGNYEKVFVKRMQEGARKKRIADKLLLSLVNALAPMYAHVYFPCHTNGLKDIGAHLGCSWTDKDASGIQSIVWRAKWEATHDEQWKEKLIG